jgi:hypothetical protein
VDYRKNNELGVDDGMSCSRLIRKGVWCDAADTATAWFGVVQFLFELRNSIEENKLDDHGESCSASQQKFYIFIIMNMITTDTYGRTASWPPMGTWERCVCSFLFSLKNRDNACFQETWPRSRSNKVRHERFASKLLTRLCL